MGPGLGLSVASSPCLCTGLTQAELLFTLAWLCLKCGPRCQVQVQMLLEQGRLSCNILPRFMMTLENRLESYTKDFKLAISFHCSQSPSEACPRPKALRCADLLATLFQQVANASPCWQCAFFGILCKCALYSDSKLLSSTQLNKWTVIPCYLKPNPWALIFHPRRIHRALLPSGPY